MENIVEAPKGVLAKPAMVYEDKHKLNHLQSRAKSSLTKIGQVAQAYEALNIGKFDNAVYQSLIAGGLSAIKNRLEEETNTTFESMRLRNESMRRETLEAAYALFNKLKGAVALLKDSARSGTVGDLYSTSFPLRLITISENGVPEITAQAEEEMREMCRLYLNTPEEVALFGKLQNAASVLNELREELEKHNTPIPTGAFGTHPVEALFKQAFEQKEGKLYAQVPFVKWAITADAERERIGRRF
ncbi:hypothetical protein CLV24_11981 [Pontibacter ummariensis]|uniref:Uncharacterized protein n=2 Tax=Pontibacter ummariensis TaxID=1610492 RepID=A0A239IYM2_9BACT|nr:hypothetical protein CLV24_11981 [Pontibacter ummariensis]SNS98710.1 hypothetical protein SAMN06296052_11981 [Pontibacter ummariensis]